MEAVEKYLLDELTPEERNEFEEHFFCCQICADQVTRNSLLIEEIKAVFRDNSLPVAQQSLQADNRGGWGKWFRLPGLTPSLAAAALAIVVGYQNLVSIPALKAPQVLLPAVLTASRSADQVVFVDKNAPRFALSFEVDSPQVYGSYDCEFLRDEKEMILRLNSGVRHVASFTLQLLLPTASFKPGRYTMILRSADEPRTEVGRYTFEVQEGSTN